MKTLNIMASALTISAAAFAVTSARADCAQDLAALKSQMGMEQSASGGTGGAGNASSDASSKTPASQDQAAAAGSTQTYTSENAKVDKPAEANATGALSGVAPTAAVGKEAQNAEESGTGTKAADGGSKSSGDMAKADGDAMKNMSGTEATKSVGDAAAKQTAQSSGGDMSTGNSADAMSTASTSNSASGSGSSGQSGQMSDMAKQHIAAAQSALDAGNEQACEAAVKAVKQSM